MVNTTPKKKSDDSPGQNELLQARSARIRGVNATDRGWRAPEAEPENQRQPEAIRNYQSNGHFVGYDYTGIIVGISWHSTGGLAGDDGRCTICIDMCL